MEGRAEMWVSVRPAGGILRSGREETEAGGCSFQLLPHSWMRAGWGGYPNVFVFPPMFTMSGRKLEVPVLCIQKNLVEGEGGAETLRRKEKDGAKHLGPQLVLSSVRPPQVASS